MKKSIQRGERVTTASVLRLCPKAHELDRSLTLPASLRGGQVGPLEALSCILYSLPALQQDVLGQLLLLHVPLLLPLLQSPGAEREREAHCD